jgi:hypothetical protein
LFAAKRDTNNSGHWFRELVREAETQQATADLQSLALLKLFEQSQVPPEVVCSNAVTRPTFLTPEILRRGVRATITDLTNDVATTKRGQVLVHDPQFSDPRTPLSV